jgi:hypothetical protein
MIERGCPYGTIRYTNNGPTRCVGGFIERKCRCQPIIGEQIRRWFCRWFRHWWIYRYAWLRVCRICHRVETLYEADGCDESATLLTRPRPDEWYAN